MPTFDSMSGAASALNLPASLLKWAKAKGCPAFRSNRVYSEELLAWLKENPPADDAADDAGMNAREKKQFQEARWWKLRVDKACGQLVERQWVVERMRAVAGGLNALRAKSEAEHPLLFAAAGGAGGDVAACRSILRDIWSEIFAGVSGLSAEFENAPIALSPPVPAKEAT